jgi:hypothetical protein
LSILIILYCFVIILHLSDSIYYYNIVESDNEGSTNLRPNLMISGDGISKAIVKIRKNSITHQDEPHRYEPKTTEKKKLVFHRAGHDNVPNNTVYHTSIHIEQAINKDIPIF